jgi:uncharacterized protein (TIGR02687 family)
MTQPRLQESLNALFASHTAVFWHDVDGEFTAAVEDLQIDRVQLVRLDQCAALRVKADIERQPAQRWLLYSNQPEPEPAADWLLDVRLRAKTFRADSTSILLEDLGLSSLSLAPHLKLRHRFLRAKDRVERLKRLVLPADDADTIDRKMLAVLLRSEEADALALTIRLLHGMWVPGEAALADAPKTWADIQGCELEGAYWQLAAQTLGYAPAAPSLPDLLLRLLTTEFARSLNGPCPVALQHLLLANKQLAGNAAVLAGRWRADLNLHKSYADLSAAVAKTLKLPELLGALPAEALVDSVTFAAIEQQVVRDLKNRLASQGAAQLDSVRPIIARRRDGHWANRLLAGASEQTRALAACYDALEAAGEFMALKERHQAGLSFADANNAVQQYRSELFAFDQLYRRFHHAAAEVEPMGWGVLHGLRDVVEAAYAGWFVPQLGSAWAKVLEGPSGLLKSWQLADLPRQQNFFDDRVATALSSSGGVKRVFVVISDALRYEAAEQLARDINGRNRLTAKLDAMLGVLPSYTSLGMAALLPHQTLAYRANATVDVLVDGQLVSTTEARSTQLAKYEGLAIQADDLLQLGKEKGRALVRDKRVVYVYHDRIDMVGDKQGSEDKTFEAVADTLTDLQQIVGFIVNSLNASMVLVTADHGFMFQESPLEEADKAALGDKPAGTLKARKRYLLGTDLPATDKAWRGNTAVTAGTEAGGGSLDFWVPKGAMRFHFAGGAKFVHGSAMPQEVIVPVLTVRGSESDHAKTHQVDISLLGASNKVVTNTQRFEFIQTEAVGERALPRTVMISLRDGEALVSDEQTVTFDSVSASMNDRVRSVFLTVRSGLYDRQRDYHLIGRDAQSKVEVLRMPMRIDLALSNDF